ncbi:MAG TPA: (2Fe-2S)-binding protein [Usitatibacter sp.]|nr:(2Fe-2S)-binding protein [Usitatibacter sp.]
MSPPNPMETLALRVNGRDREVAAAPGATLLQVLRDGLGLVAARFGCGTEQCGACVVLMDGTPIYSCTLPASAAAGRGVTTLEGLSTEGAASPLQRALIAEQAAQCGYCLSGIAMRATALLAAKPDPTEDEVRQALDPHLCRCGSHNRMVRAVLRAAREMREAAR